MQTISLIGAGAIGCLWASALNKANKSCEIIVHSPSKLETLKKEGIEFHSQLDDEESFTFLPPAVLNSKLSQTPNILLVCTKATQTIRALEQIKNSINTTTKLVLFQNGMGSQQQAHKLFPNNEIFCAVTTEGAFTQSAFSVTHAGKGNTHIGIYKNSSSEKELSTLLSALNNPYINVTSTSDIEQNLMNKLAINAGINPYTVFYACKNGELLHIPEALNAIEKSCEEIASILITQGFTKNGQEIFSDVKTVLQNTANNTSSMRQDILKQKPTEIDFINGYIVETARAKNLPHAENLRMLNYIKEQEKKFL